jgi:hypothetical protein
LGIGIDRPKLNAGNLAGNHAVHGVAAATTYANDLNTGDASWHDLASFGSFTGLHPAISIILKAATDIAEGQASTSIGSAGSTGVLGGVVGGWVVLGRPQAVIKRHGIGKLKGSKVRLSNRQNLQNL